MLFRYDTGFIKSLAAFWINGQRLDTPQHVNNTKYVYLDWLLLQQILAGFLSLHLPLSYGLTSKPFLRSNMISYFATKKLSPLSFSEFHLI